MPKAIGPLEARLREWVRVRLEDKAEERGERTKLAVALGVTASWVNEYLKERRHLSLDQMVKLMKHYRLNAHQLIDELPLPPADSETRQMLVAWERTKQTPLGATARALAFDTLVRVAELRGPFQPDEIVPPAASRETATPEKAPKTNQKKHGAGG